MVSWGELQAEAPAMAAQVQARIEATGLVLVGTLRADGWPRISPVEPVIHAGRFDLGMMWRSAKALDLRRDPRCVVHSTVVDRSGGEGEAKLYGVVDEIDDTAERDRYGVALEAATGWRPKGEWHLFRLSITTAVVAVFGEPPRWTDVWHPGAGIRRIERD